MQLRAAPHDEAPAVACAGVTKRFGDVVAVAGFDLVVPRGQVTALLGPSGCGKTTALRMIAGFEQPDGGEVRLGGELVADGRSAVAPERRRVGMVFQDHALFPHMTVRQNIEYGLHHLPRAERRAVAEDALALVDLPGLGDRLPADLSGGQRQRVALARAMAPRPEVVLLDEPFSNLDAALRVQVREDVRSILKAAGATAIVVTHDQEEALSLADTVAVMAAGRVHQVARPRELYTRPATPFVARFVGDADLLPGTPTGTGAVRTVLGDLPTVEPVASSAAEVVVRPETLRVLPAADGNGIVTDVTYFGHDQLLHVLLDDGTAVRARQGPIATAEPGERVRVTVDGPVVAFGTGNVREAAPVAA